MTMQDDKTSAPAASKRPPWNKGKLIGAKPPLRPKHVWSIRTKLQIADRKRDLAMFNLAIDSKLRGCDVVALKVENIAPHGYADPGCAETSFHTAWTHLGRQLCTAAFERIWIWPGQS
jgi:hypothetical protein